MTTENEGTQDRVLGSEYFEGDNVVCIPTHHMRNALCNELAALRQKNKLTASGRASRKRHKTPRLKRASSSRKRIEAVTVTFGPTMSAEEIIEILYEIIDDVRRLGPKLREMPECNDEFYN